MRGRRGRAVRSKQLVALAWAIAGLAIALTATGAGAFSLTSGGPTPPRVTGVSPKEGPAAGGSAVTITGSGFVDVQAVEFSGIPAASFEVNSSTSITATTPAATTGVTYVTVTTADGGTSGVGGKDHFVFGKPTVTAVSPAEGPVQGGSRVTITGSGFAVGSGETVFRFSKTPGSSVECASSTSCTVLAPAGRPRAVDVKASVGRASSHKNPPGDLFTYVPVPDVKTISPKSGPAAGGTLVTITGKAFIDVRSVQFGTTAVSYEVHSPTDISAVAPPGTSGEVPVSVTTASGAAPVTHRARFKYGLPTVTAIGPAHGPAGGGNSVAISGSGFALGSDKTAFRFGKTDSALVYCSSTTSCTASPPSEPGRTIDVRAHVGKFTSKKNRPDDLYTYVPAPTVNKLTPGNGTTAGGATVTLTGKSFIDVLSVHFGATSVAFTVDSDTTITVTSPAGSGAVPVTVTTASGTSAQTQGATFHYR